MSITLANGSNGGLAANYSISPGQTTTAHISKKSLTVSSINASNKIYDGNNSVIKPLQYRFQGLWGVKL